MHAWGLGTRSDPTRPDGGNNGESGRADVIAYRNSLAVAIEFKYGKTGFNPFSKTAGWKRKQRLWARRWCIQEFGVDYYLFLSMGTHPPHYHPEKYMPRRSWLIPYHAMRSLERVFILAQMAGDTAIQQTIPYRAGKGYSTFLQEHKLDAIHLFRDYELVWQKGSNGKPGYWQCPEQHIFFQRYLVPRKPLIALETDNNIVRRFELWKLIPA